MKTVLSLLLLSSCLIACGKVGGLNGLASNVTGDNSGSNNSSGTGSSECHQMDTESCEAFKATNVARAQNGLPAMQYCEACFQMAQEQCDDMNARSYFAHDRPAFPDRVAESFSHRAGRFGLSFGVGENIASGATGQAAVDMWMGSPGHRANILNPNFHSFAVGTRNGLSTQVFSM